jgi:hypothetical protein
MYYNLTASNHSVVVLNSVSNITRALPTLSRYQKINAYLDNDTAGSEGTNKLIENGLNVTDSRTMYPFFKDFSDFWQSKIDF